MAKENPLALAGLNAEARKRGMTYGELVAVTTEEERSRMVDQFTREYNDHQKRLARERKERARREKEQGRKKKRSEASILAGWT